MGERGPWHSDEFILVLDLYFRVGLPEEGRDDPAVVELSQLLRRFPYNLDVRGPRYRSPSSVMRRLLNYAFLDGKSGLSGGGTECKRFWHEYAGRADDVARLSAAIKEAIPHDIRPVLEEEEAAFEGATIARMHVEFERDPGLARRKKASALQRRGRLACEVCDFDFHAAYGERGVGFIECHHRVPLSELRISTPHRLRDLSLVCANCHRMIHRRPTVTVEALRDELQATK